MRVSTDRIQDCCGWVRNLFSYCYNWLRAHCGSARIPGKFYKKTHLILNTFVKGFFF
jgi:hypothetical protein